MSNIALWIYLMDMVDRLRSVVGATLTAAVTIGFILTLFSNLAPVDEGDRKTMTFMMKICLGVFVSCVPIFILTPDSKTIAAMVVVPAIVENQRVQNLGDNSMKLIEEKMKAWLDEQMKKAEGRHG